MTQQGLPSTDTQFAQLPFGNNYLKKQTAATGQWPGGVRSAERAAWGAMPGDNSKKQTQCTLLIEDKCALPAGVSAHTENAHFLKPDGERFCLQVINEEREKH